MFYLREYFWNFKEIEIEMKKVIAVLLLLVATVAWGQMREFKGWTLATAQQPLPKWILDAKIIERMQPVAFSQIDTEAQILILVNKDENPITVYKITGNTATVYLITNFIDKDDPFKYYYFKGEVRR